MERQPDVADRRLDALLERLDRIADELHGIRRRLDQDEHMVRIERELSSLNDSLQALAYAALGHQGPQVRRKRTG
jgi:DNA-binding FrmR family transcriptional regulator